MNLLFIHLGEGGEELLDMLGGGRIAVGHSGPVNECHRDFGGSPAPG